MSVIEKLIPVLVCQDLPAEHDFLINVLGFSSGGIHHTPEGQAVHAEVRAGNLMVWLHRVAEDLKLVSPRSIPAASSGLFVYVDDVDAHHARVRSHGTRSDSEPKDMPYGQRDYGVTDPEGRLWFGKFITKGAKP